MSVPEASSGSGTAQLTVERGTCYVIYAYDVASSIDLAIAQSCIESTQQLKVEQKRRAPEYFEYRPAPLRSTQAAPVLPVGNFTTAPQVEIVMYDFGAVSISFAISIPGPVSALIQLAAALRENGVLREEARRQLDQLMVMLAPAAEKARIAAFVEDYLLFQVDEWRPGLDATGLARCLPPVAQVLRAETRALSDQEVEQATALRSSFGPGDVSFIDTDAAMVFDPDAADVRAVVEFANAQLLEMRVLDQQLDEVLERSYDLLGRYARPALVPFRHRETWTVAQYQIDAAILFERVTNALKLIGEQYLTRIYGLASRRFHLAEWDASISRKLETVESIYEKMAAQASTRRMEVLEWIIIVLIAVSIVLPFIPGFGAK